jgi:tetratricopeptide (TPR) repeat protein
MEDNELDLDSLVKKYEHMQALGKNIYLDADEFAMLIDYYSSGGDQDEAEILIEEGLKIHPGSSLLMLAKAKLLIFSTKYEEALDYLRFTSDDSDLDHWLLKIEALLHLSEFDEVEKMSIKVLERNLPEEDFYYFITELGFLLNDVDKFDRAIAYFEESLKINDSNADVIVDLAYAYEMKGDMAQAIVYNNLLLDIDPYSFDAWVNIGKLYSMNEQHEKAIDSFDFALTIKDDDLSAMKMKALSLYLNDNVQESIKLFRKCLSLSPNDESVHDSLLEAYAALELYDEMMNLIDLKEELFGSEGIMAKRASVYISKQEYDTAKELFLQIPENDKDNLDYYMLEGELAFNENDFTKAESAYIKASLISEENEDILDRLANICVAQEKYIQAAEYLEELLDIAPDFPTAKSRLAFIRFEIGSKEPFNEIMQQFSNEELRLLLSMLMGNEISEYDDYSRDKILTRLNEARENRVLFKNIKY